MKKLSVMLVLVLTVSTLVWTVGTWKSVRGSSDSDAQFTILNDSGTDRLLAEAESYRRTMEEARDLNPAKAAVYRSLLEQAETRLEFDPLKVSWRAFYETSSNRRAGDVTILQAALSRFVLAGTLTEGDAAKVFALVAEERRLLDEHYRETHRELIAMWKSGGISPEEGAATKMELLEKRGSIRSQHQARWERVLPSQDVRDEIARHVRNDQFLIFNSNGRVRGGVGFRPKDLAQVTFSDE